MRFVTAEKSVGTFFAEKSTCLYQVALLFASSPGSYYWPSFAQVVVDSIPEHGVVCLNRAKRANIL